VQSLDGFNSQRERATNNIAAITAGGCAGELVRPCRATRVFPLPPAPVNVSNRTSSRRRRSATSRSSDSPEKRRRGYRQIGVGKGLQQWKGAVVELVEPLRRGEILQPVSSEIADFDVDEGAGRGSDSKPPRCTRREPRPPARWR
jgi:hypothetical protein